MKLLALSGKRANGQSVKVDDADFKKYGHLRWHLSDTGYAVRRQNHETMRLHRLIMNCPEGLVVDHLNGDTLDCRKANMRICTQAENAKNYHGAKGYCFDKNKGKWLVRYRNKFYGRYDTEQEAQRVYQLAKSGKEYEKTRRKYNMLPKHISKQFGKYNVSVQVAGKRYRKAGFKTIAEAVSWRDELYKTLERKG